MNVTASSSIPYACSFAIGRPHGIKSNALDRSMRSVPQLLDHSRAFSIFLEDALKPIEYCNLS